jgi:hypothetical protein
VITGVFRQLQLEPQRPQHVSAVANSGLPLDDRRLAEVLAARHRPLSDLGHAFGASDIAQCGRHQSGVAILEHRFEIAGDVSSVFR